MNDLIYSSAVLCLSQTTEFMRNKSVDNTVIHLIVQNGLNEFTIRQAYDAIHNDLPIRLEEIQKSIERSYSNRIVEILGEDKDDFKNAKFKINPTITNKLEAHCEQLKLYLDEAINELFDGLVNASNRNTVEQLLLDVVTQLMAKYGYAYAGQLAGIADATEFVPAKELQNICESSISKYDFKISANDLSECVSILFDRRDPRLNNLAFSICNRYYMSRLIGLDLPIDFITENIYKDSTIYLDTNFIMRIAFSKGNRHNEFRAIL